MCSASARSRSSRADSACLWRALARSSCARRCTSANFSRNAAFSRSKAIARRTAPAASSQRSFAKADMPASKKVFALRLRSSAARLAPRLDLASRLRIREQLVCLEQLLEARLHERREGADPAPEVAVGMQPLRESEVGLLEGALVGVAFDAEDLVIRALQATREFEQLALDLDVDLERGVDRRARGGGGSRGGGGRRGRGR